MKVSADGHGVVSHAGMGKQGELADRTGLSAYPTLHAFRLLIDVVDLFTQRSSKQY